MLRALAASWITDRPHSGVEEPYQRLLDVRDALHVTSGRAVDRLLAAEVGEVADLMGFADTDALRRDVSMAARRIGHAVYLTSRAARQVLPQLKPSGVGRVLSFARRERRPEYIRADHGLIIHAGEVGLDKNTDPAGPLRRAARRCARGRAWHRALPGDGGQPGPARPRYRRSLARRGARGVAADAGDRRARAPGLGGPRPRLGSSRAGSRPGS